jgi:hypothetical protein
MGGFFKDCKIEFEGDVPLHPLCEAFKKIRGFFEIYKEKQSLFPAM